MKLYVVIETSGYYECTDENDHYSECIGVYDNFDACAKVINAQIEKELKSVEQAQSLFQRESKITDKHLCTKERYDAGYSVSGFEVNDGEIYRDYEIIEKELNEEPY